MTNTEQKPLNLLGEVVTLPEAALDALHKDGAVRITDQTFIPPEGCLLEEISLPWLKPTVLNLKTRESVMFDHPEYHAGQTFKLTTGEQITITGTELHDLNHEFVWVVGLKLS